MQYNLYHAKQNTFNSILIIKYLVGLGNIEFVTCNHCMNYLLRLLQYCIQKFEAQPHSLKSL